jgi:hypothetical protein
VAWEARQRGGREGVGERSCVASASADALRRARLPADLAKNSPPPENGLTWRSGCLFLLSAELLRVEVVHDFTEQKVCTEHS